VQVSTGGDSRRRRAELLMERSHCGLRVGASPGDCWLPLVRARASAYPDALEQLDKVLDCVAEALFDVPPVRHRVLPARAALRHREAAATVRRYLLDCSNEQWLAPWERSQRLATRSRFRAQLFSAAKWRKLGDDLLAGRERVVEQRIGRGERQLENASRYHADPFCY
jgi:hypothetical protein